MLIGEGQHFPKRPNFTIKPHGNYENTGLDFNAIYYDRWEHDSGLKVPDIHISYSYYRFWPNGRVMQKNSEDRLPTKEETEDFTNAILGYYQVSGQNLEMELFIPDSVIWNWDYQRIFGIIDENRIINNRDEIRGETSDFEEIKIKYNLGELTSQPNW